MSLPYLPSMIPKSLGPNLGINYVTYTILLYIHSTMLCYKKITFEGEVPHWVPSAQELRSFMQVRDLSTAKLRTHACGAWISQLRRDNSALCYLYTWISCFSGVAYTAIQPLPRRNLAAAWRRLAGTEVIRPSINALPPRYSATSCLHDLGAWHRTWV
jgi:hypothetical protein